MVVTDKSLYRNAKYCLSHCILVTHVTAVSKLISNSQPEKKHVVSKSWVSKHVDKMLRANSVRCKQVLYMNVCYFKRNFHWFHNFKKSKRVLSATRVSGYLTGTRVTGTITSAYHQHVVEEKHFTLMLACSSFTFVGVDDLEQPTVTDQTTMRQRQYLIDINRLKLRSHWHTHSMTAEYKVA